MLGAYVPYTTQWGKLMPLPTLWVISIRARLDANAIKAATYAFVVVGYTYLPSISTGIDRGVLKAIGNKGVSWI